MYLCTLISAGNVIFNTSSLLQETNQTLLKQNSLKSCIKIAIIIEIKSVVHSSQGIHTGQLDFWN
jgi:hypothetical protein